MTDDECEEYTTSQKRIEALGFKPQKEIALNTLLPYADQLDEESNRLFAQIKSNLAKSVMLREMKPAVGVWTARLIKYLRIYGFKFSKEDHIALVKLVFELVIIPDLEPLRVHKFTTLFVMLTSKRPLITPEELVLPWRPLHELGKRLFDKTATKIGLYHYFRDVGKVDDADMLINMFRELMSGSGVQSFLSFGSLDMDETELPKSVETSYWALVKCAKPYFPLNATKEVLAELLPQVTPWSSDSRILAQLTMFLPVGLHPRHADIGHKLWLEQLLTLWDTCYNGHCNVGDLLPLFAYLAKRNPGAVDWAPRVPQMFTRFLRAFNLPVSYKDMQLSKNQTFDIKNMATWIVWTINPDGVTLKHLRSFLGGVDSYLHSANSGRWSFKLKDLLRKLAREFMTRVRREKRKIFKKCWENQTPPEYKLREEDITEFVQILIEPSLSAVFSRSGVSVVSLTLQNLASLRPAIVIPPILEKFRSSLESLTEPHRMTAAMQAATAVARPILQGPTLGYPEGPTHVVPLLISSLPGLDPNDIKKTLVTLHFILVFSWMVPFIDCSSAHEYWNDLTEEERLTCESTAQFEDFVLLYFDRLFTIIESSKLENARFETKESESLRSKSESIIETALLASATAVLLQCSPKIYSEALRKFKSFAMTSTFETNVAGNIVGVILKVFARVNPAATLAAFLPQLSDEIMELLATDEALEEENVPRELLYRLLLLSHVVECDGVILMGALPHILPVLDRALKMQDRESYMIASEVLAHIMSSLSIVELKEFRSTSKDYSEAPQKWLPIREWGRLCPIKEANLKWHTPSKEEAECAQQLFDRYAKPEIEMLRAWVAGDPTIDRKKTLRAFFIINSTLIFNNFMPHPEETPVLSLESQVPAVAFPLATGVQGSVTLDGENMRVGMTRLLLQVQSKMIIDKSDDTRGFEMLIQLWERVSGVRPMRSGASLESRMRSYAALERALDGKSGPLGGGRIRTLLADAVKLQDDARSDLQSDAGIGPTGIAILHALFELSIHSYTTVRMLAQLRLHWMLNHYAYSYRALLPKLLQLLGPGGEAQDCHVKHKGALYVILGPRSSPFIAKQDWEVMRALWPAILHSPLSEKPSIVKIEHSFHEGIRRNFPTMNTRLTVSGGCIEAATVLLSDADKEDAQFLENFSAAEERERTVSAKNETLYYELIEDLVTVAETPALHRRRLELAIHMLMFVPNMESPYPPNACKLIANSLIHDNIAVRRAAVTLMMFAMKQRKRKIKKIPVDPYQIAGCSKPDKITPGYRADLEWALWTGEGPPKTDEDWDRPWLRNMENGFYTWPDHLMVAAPFNEQPPLNRKPEDMELGERYIYEFFTDPEKIARLVDFLTVEEKKGKDKFNVSRFYMFKYLFSTFGETVTHMFLSYALINANTAIEAKQRFACEIVAAAIRAPRFWDRITAIRTYEQTVQVMQAGLSSVIPETMEDWAVSVASAVENLDPRRGAIVYNSMLELCTPREVVGPDADADQESSFGVCARLYALQSLLGSLTWRGAPLASALLHRLDVAKFIQHPYQNVRESIGSMLMAIFNTELVFPGGDLGPAPCLANFLAETMPKLSALYDEHGEIMTSTGAGAMSCVCAADAARGAAALAAPLAEMEAEPLVGVANANADADADVARLSPLEPVADEQQPQQVGNDEGEAEPVARLECADKKALTSNLEAGLRLSGEPATHGPREHARALNLLSTVLRGCSGVVVICINGSTGAQYRLLSTAFALAARGPPQPHDEMARAADAFLASLAMAHHSPRAFDDALDELERVTRTRSWWARLASVTFAQPLLFYALPMMCAEPGRAVRAEAYALALMKDQRIEVRQAAAKLLTGLMHCQALPNEDVTIKRLMKNCRSENNVERHCGVLGLCAYLSSRPYSLGPRLGVVLAELARHTNAPDPIPSSIRTALADFRRTHQDDWPKHREALTADELDLLADLTSPPSYCA